MSVLTGPLIIVPNCAACRAELNARPWRSKSRSCSADRRCWGRSRRSTSTRRQPSVARLRHMPSQLLATLSAVEDQDFEPFWLRHELPPCATLRERSDRCRVSRHLSCSESSERVVSRIYSVRLDQPSHRRPHRGSRRSSSWPYSTKGARCGWRDPPAGLRDRSGGMR